MIELKHLCRDFGEGKLTIHAVNDVSLTIESGDIFGVIGFSGAGKSTLVRCINLLERPDSGTVLIDGVEMTALKPAELREARKKIGMIFQHFNLMPSRTVAENIAYPLKGSGLSRQERDEKVRELLKLVELEEKEKAYPSQLSGGQKQRVAIARALANEPKVLLCDEATSALDPQTTRQILKLLKTLNEKLGITIVLITHEMAVIKAIAERVAVMENGRVVEEGTVYDIFANPQAEITRKFVASSSLLGRLEKMLEEDAELLRIKPGEMLVRMVFDKDYVGEAVITTAARKFGFDLNLILANAEYLHGSPIGGIVGILRGDPEKIREGIAYMAENHVRTEVLRDGKVDHLSAEHLDC